MFLSKNLVFLSKKVNINDLAKRNNKDSTTLNKIMNGTTTNPKIENLLIIFYELQRLNLINNFDELLFKDLENEVNHNE